MDSLALLACDAHGGLARWLRSSSITARVVAERTSGGRIFSTAFGLEAGMQVTLVCLDDYGPDRHVTSFSPERVALFDAEGTIIEQGNPVTMKGWHGRLGLSDDLGDICAFSLSVWTYLNFPFLTTLEGFTCMEKTSSHDTGRQQRTLLVEFPPDAEGGRVRFLAHIAPDGRTRRLDWYAGDQTDVISAAYLIAHADVDGLLIPSHILALHSGRDCIGPQSAFTDIVLTEVRCE
jgi:hypothetical protein